MVVILGLITKRQISKQACTDSSDAQAVTDISKEHRRAGVHAEATVDTPQSQKGLVLTKLASKQPQELPRIKENKDGNATI